MDRHRQSKTSPPFAADPGRADPEHGADLRRHHGHHLPPPRQRPHDTHRRPLHRIHHPQRHRVLLEPSHTLLLSSHGLLELSHGLLCLATDY